MSRARSPDATYRTAIHEAGHVAMLLAQGMRFRRVTIRPKDDYLGAVLQHLGKRLRAALEHGDFFETTRAAESQIRVALAGEIAVRLHCGGRNATEGCGQDAEAVWKALRCAHEDDSRIARAHLRFLRLQSAVILGRPIQRVHVQAVAKALLADSSLTYGQCCAAIRSAMMDAGKGGTS